MEKSLKYTVEIDIQRSSVNWRKRVCKVKQAKITTTTLTSLAPFCSRADAVTTSLCPYDL